MEQNFKIIFFETLKCPNLRISNNCNSITVYSIVMKFCMNIKETSFQGAMSLEFLILRPNLNYASLYANWLDFGRHGNQSKQIKHLKKNLALCGISCRVCVNSESQGMVHSFITIVWNFNQSAVLFGYHSNHVNKKLFFEFFETCSLQWYIIGLHVRLILKIDVKNLVNSMWTPP